MASVLAKVDLTSMTALRRELQKRNISTTTPNLKGEERRKELVYRLKEVLNIIESESDSSTEDSGNLSEQISKPIDWNSMLSIRKHLLARNLSVSTPGATNEERREVLKCRLKAFLSKKNEKRRDVVKGRLEAFLSKKKDSLPNKNVQLSLQTGLWNKPKQVPAKKAASSARSETRLNADRDATIVKNNSTLTSVDQSLGLGLGHDFVPSSELLSLQKKLQKQKDEIATIEKRRRDIVFKRLSGAEGTELFEFMNAFRSVKHELDRVCKWKKRFIDSSALCIAAYALGTESKNNEETGTTTRFHVDEAIVKMKKSLSDKRMSVMAEERHNPLTGVIVQREKQETISHLQEKVESLYDYELDTHIHHKKEKRQDREMKQNSDRKSKLRVSTESNKNRHGGKHSRKSLRKGGAAAVARRAATGLSDYSAQKAMRAARVRLAAKFNDQLSRSGSANPVGKNRLSVVPGGSPVVQLRGNDIIAPPPSGDSFTETNNSKFGNRYAKLPHSRRFDFDNSDSIPPRISGISASRNEESIVYQNPDKCWRQAFVKYIAKQDIKGASTLFMKGIALHPYHPELLHQYANFIRTTTRNSELASNLYLRALEAFSKGRNTNLNDAERYSAGITMFDHGMHMQACGQTEAALNSFKKAVVACPNHPRLLAKLAVTLHRILPSEKQNDRPPSRAKNHTDIVTNSRTPIKEKLRVQDLYERAFVADRFNVKNLVNYALFSQRLLKNNNLAEKLFLQASILDPFNGGILSNFAAFLVKEKNDYNRAEAYYRRGIENDPKHAGCIGNYASFLWRVRNDTKSSHAYFEKAMQLSPNHANNLGKFASLLKSCKKFKEAETLYERAIAADPANATILGNFANFVKKIRGDNKYAKNLYLKALQIEPNHRMNRRNYGLLLRDCPELRDGPSRVVYRSEFSNTEGKIASRGK